MKNKNEEEDKQQKDDLRMEGVGDRKFIALKVPKFCVLVLPVKVSWG